MSESEKKNKTKQFLNNFKDYVANFVKTYNEGLFALVVALLTFGLERLLDEDVFSCPRKGYQAYAIAFFVCPIIMLTLLNLLTLPGEGGVRIWSLCERCWVTSYHRRGDFFGGFLTALCVGLVAPTAWTFLALLDAQHLVCWELGYDFGDNVTDSYLDDRGFGYMTIKRYYEKIDEAKARSHIAAVIVLAAAVLILFFVVILRRSCLKPFDDEKRLQGLHHLEEIEAFAARDELDRLVSDNDEFDQFSVEASLLQFLVIEERILALKNELEELKNTPTDGKKTHEVQLEIAEFGDLEIVLHFWAEWYKLDRKKELQIIREDSKELEAAEKTYKNREEKLWEKRKAREDEAKKFLEKYESLEEGEVSFAETNDAIHQAWILARLDQQKSLFNVEDLVKRWQKAKDAIKRLRQSLDSHEENGFIECPQVRGRIVASYIIKLYKDQNDYCLTSEQVLEKFRSIFPRVATSDPSRRYVNVNNPMYKYIIDADVGTTSGENTTVPVMYSCVKPWNEENELDWVRFMRKNHEHSWLWKVFGCRNAYCPKQNVSQTNETVEDGRQPLINA